MEHPPHNEQAARREWLVLNLQAKGLEDPEVKERLTVWLETEQNARSTDRSEEALDPTKNFGSGLEAFIQFGLLLKDAGMIGEAREQLVFAWNDANQMGNSEMCAEIDGIIDSLQG